jgi:DNA primase
MQNQYLKNLTNQEVTEKYLKIRFSKIKTTSNGYLTKCPFRNHEHDDKAPAFNIKKDGRYYCFKCQAKGNLISLAKHLGDDLRNLF